MSSFLGAGLAWLETDETPAVAATAAMSVTTAKPRRNPRIEPPLVATRHRVAAAGGALDLRSRRGLPSARAMRRLARAAAAAPQVVVTVLMLVAIADMLTGV